MTAGEQMRGALLRSTPRVLLLGGLGAIGLWHGLRWLAVHLQWVAAVLLILLTWWAVDRIGWPWLVLATGCVCIGLGAVMELQPRWWRKTTRAYASRRRLAWYRQRWEPAMVGSGLTRGDDLPELIGHRFGGQPWERDLDVLTVRTLPGQVLTDWRHVQHRLAAAWGRTRVRAHTVPGVPAPPRTAGLTVQLFCSSRPLPAGASADWLARRQAVAGGQVPVSTATLEQVQAFLDEPSTAVDDPVDGQPSGPFPRTPRGEQ